MADPRPQTQRAQDAETLKSAARILDRLGLPGQAGALRFVAKSFENGDVPVELLRFPESGRIQ